MSDLVPLNLPDSFARITVKGFFLQDGKLLLGRDATFVKRGKPEYWELPGGGWEFGESFQDTLKREVSEETGLEVTHVGEQPMFAYPIKRGPSILVPQPHWGLVLLFRMDLKNLDFTPSEECTRLGLFAHDEFMALDDLYLQTQPLKNILTEKDFK
jgi:8-oxo-dGTP diphosphatase